MGNNLQRLPERALDTLYDSLSVHTMPEGRYDGRAWIYGHPVLGWLASLVWAGKVFTGRRVRNRVLGMLLIEGSVALALWRHDGLSNSQWREIYIVYPRLCVQDTFRQVSPTLYLGRLQWRRWAVHFTLSQER